jgi:MYXO-CTERM domain-containing protein
MLRPLHALARNVLTLASLAGCAAQPASPISLGGDIVLPPKGAPATGLRREADTQARKVVYLNFEGGPLACGLADDATADTSSIICNLTYPRFEADGFGCDDRERCIAEIVDLVRTTWRDFRIDLVTERPAAGDYEMVMIGGNVSGGAAGLANLDCGDLQPRNVAFAFSVVVSGHQGCSREMLATTISQELAHGLGICHNDDCAAPVASVMCPRLSTCESDWGPGCQIDACPCYSGCADPHQMLIDLLGPAETDPPAIDVVSPRNGSTVPCGDFTVWVDVTDATAAGQVHLFEGGSEIGTADAPPYSFPVVNPERGSHTYDVVAFDTIGNRAEASLSVEVSCGAPCIAGSCCCGDLCCRPVCDCQERAPTGQPCMKDADCRGDLCVSQDAFPGTGSVCSELCRGDGDCPDGFLCAEEDGRRVCRQDVWADTGQPCRKNSDCATGLCAPGGGDSFCTIPCDVQDSGACPADLSCRAPEQGADPLCLGAAASGGGGGGCAVSPPGGNAAWLALLGLLLALRRR